MTDKNTETIKLYKKPRIVKEIMGFLETMGFCSEFIPECAEKVKELREIMKRAGMTEACRILEGEKGTIFTDSAYGFGVCHYYGTIWARNNFRKTNGKSIKHEKEIRDLLQSCLGPTELSIVKCDAHQKGEDKISLGNNFADPTAKAAAKRETELGKGKGILVLTRAQIAKKTECIQIRGPEEIIKEQQKQAGEQEKLGWKIRGANEVGEIWRMPQGQVVVTEQLEQMVLSQAHRAGHNNRTELIIKQ